MKGPLAGLLASLLVCSAWGQAGEIHIDASKLGPRVPKELYGVFLEEISHAGEGGLYAELIQNRGFEDADTPPACHIETLNDRSVLVPPRTPHYWNMRISDWTMPWNVDSKFPGWSLHNSQGAEASIHVVEDRPLNNGKPHALALAITNCPSGGQVSVENDGFWGVPVTKGEGYKLRLWAQGDGSYTGPVTAVLVSQAGKVIGSKELPSIVNGQYKLITGQLVSSETDAHAKLALRFGSKGNVWLAYVSLFPAKTFKNRPNGLRPDLAQMIADLKPGFVRYPGGCYVEGLTIETRAQWQLTLGPLEERTPTYSPWGYWNSNGFGYHEWLQFCEDIGAEPLYVFNVGVSCAFRSGTFLPDDQVPGLIRNTLDGIEYANGPVTSKWGALRAKNGHPKPFNMKYVEIGNEQQGPKYGQRVALFYKAIKEKYPNVKVILSSWIAGIDHRAIDVAGKIDIVDEHSYRPLNWSIWNFDSFAKYPRNVDWSLYIGEFACNSGVGRGNLAATLNDSAYMMSMEKNSDLVKMGSYAPLLENVNSPHWPVNMIHFDSARAFGRATYYACKLFAENRPDVNLTTQVQLSTANVKPVNGPIGVGSFATQVEFKDIKVEQAGQAVYASDFSKGIADWKLGPGAWSVQDGNFGERGTQDYNERFSFQGNDYHDMDLTLKARKIKGAEGFLVSVGNVDGMRVQVNFGGWGNTIHAVQVNSSEPVASVRGRIEDGRWYDIKVDTRGRELTAYLDGKQILKTSLPSSNALLAIAGRDDRTHEVVVKVVNNGSDAKAISVKLDGVRGVAPEGTQTVLTSAKPVDENSFSDPTKIVPQTSKLIGLATTFEHTFPPYSLTILRFKAS